MFFGASKAKIRWFNLLVVPLVLVAACGDGGDDGPNQSIAFQLIARNVIAQASVSQPVMHATSSAELDVLWNHSALTGAPRPVVDFSKQTVLLLEKQCPRDCDLIFPSGPEIVIDEESVWYRSCGSSLVRREPWEGTSSPPINIVEVLLLESPGFVGGKKIWLMNC